MKISASFLSSKNRKEDIKKLNQTDVDYIHVDYMDGKFVSNKSISYRKIKRIVKNTQKKLDVHLMVENPEKLISKFAKLNTEYITIHLEIAKDIEKLLGMIHDHKIKAGLSIRPDTKVEELIPYLDQIDLILVMSVVPGKGGQAFLKETAERIKEIQELLEQKQKQNILISVDGGITNQTKERVKTADILVSGSYIINSDNFQEQINKLR